MNKFEINIGLFGVVSVGKSTFLNAISGYQYSDTEIKRTTMVPQVYLEDTHNISSAETIRENNRKINEHISREIDLNKFTIEKCKPIYHHIDRICDLFDPQIIDTNIRINIYDIPGLNDSASKNIYFEWVRRNIKLFDIIIFMTDITKGLNNSDEIEVLNLLMDSIKKYQNRMICLMNKCDDIYFDHEQNDLVFEEKEQENIYIQANNILADIAKSHGFTEDDNYFTPFFPISSENCYVYRVLMRDPTYKLDQIHQNRICKNEYGSNNWKKMNHNEKEIMFNKIVSELGNTYSNKILDTGYLAVKMVIQNTISMYKQEFIINRIRNDIKELELISTDNISGYVKMVDKIIAKIDQAVGILGDITYEPLLKNIQTMITNYISMVNKIPIVISNSKRFIDFKEFENLHSTLEVHCVNFSMLIESIKKIKGYPEELIKNNQDLLINKLLSFYDQLSNIESVDQMHTCPANLLHFLQMIKTYIPIKFLHYAEKFLTIYSNPKCKHIIIYQNEFLDLVEYISNNLEENADRNNFYSLISIFIVNRLSYIQNKFPETFIVYLIKLKKKIHDIICKIPNDIFSSYNILYEIISKYIVSCLGGSSISNIYLECDNHKMSSLLSKLIGRCDCPDIDFETKLLEAFIIDDKIELKTKNMIMTDLIHV